MNLVSLQWEHQGSPGQGSFRACLDSRSGSIDPTSSQEKHQNAWLISVTTCAQDDIPRVVVVRGSIFGTRDSTPQLSYSHSTCSGLTHTQQAGWRHQCVLLMSQHGIHTTWGQFSLCTAYREINSLRSGKWPWRTPQLWSGRGLVGLIAHALFCFPALWPQLFRVFCWHQQKQPGELIHSGTSRPSLATHSQPLAGCFGQGDWKTFPVFPEYIILTPTEGRGMLSASYTRKRARLNGFRDLLRLHKGTSQLCCYQYWPERWTEDWRGFGGERGVISVNLNTSWAPKGSPVDTGTPARRGVSRLVQLPVPTFCWFKQGERTCSC